MNRKEHKKIWTLAGYSSHLIADSTTPRGLPLIK